MNIRLYIWWILCFLICVLVEHSISTLTNIVEATYWSCLLKKRYTCPDNDIRFYLYIPEDKHNRRRIDARNPLALKYSGWEANRKNVIILHGFNGTESNPPMTRLKHAFLRRGDYNVIMVDWHPLTRFPCYLSSLSNTRLVSQCVAQFYAHMMDSGGSAEKTTCVGHSLGAHICGMISSHLTKKQYRIVGLDPARPLVSVFGSRQFRLTKEDAHQVQVIHTNAGVLGETDKIGHVDFCVNGGSEQPGCKGHKLRRARCSHFQSVCYFAETVENGGALMGIPCSSSCPKTRKGWSLLPGRSIPMGYDTPFSARGMYCVANNKGTDCPFN